VRSLTRKHFEADGSWFDEAAELARGEWQNDGYFNARVEGSSIILREDSTAIHAALALSIDQGRRYRLGEVHIRNADPSAAGLAIPETRVRELMPLRSGDLFNVGKIWNGLEALKDAYGNEGYIDFTAQPQTDVDEARGIISLTLELQEERRYYIGKVEIIGLDPAKQHLLKSPPKSGELFRLQRIKEFYRMNRDILPSGATYWTSMDFARDAGIGTVDLKFDFHVFVCPQFDE